MSRILPILFNADMVRAILEGRKTVTRRLIKPSDCNDEYGFQVITSKSGDFMRVEKVDENESGIFSDETERYVNPPYQSGDILYVRETIWQRRGHSFGIDGEIECIWMNDFRYVATDDEPVSESDYESWVKRPSIHMPKEAARIWLKVTSVGVERLQDINPEQLRHEGLRILVTPGECKSQFNKIGAIADFEEKKKEFKHLWNSTLKDIDRYGWDTNPWVWVIEFEQCEKTKDG